MSKFKKRSADDFVNSAKVRQDVQKYPAMTSRLHPDILEKLQAMAYVNKSKSQRMILEEALQDYFKKNSKQLDEALELYRKISQ